MRSRTVRAAAEDETGASVMPSFDSQLAVSNAVYVLCVSSLFRFLCSTSFHSPVRSQTGCVCL